MKTINVGHLERLRIPIVREIKTERSSLTGMSFYSYYMSPCEYNCLSASMWLAC